MAYTLPPLPYSFDALEPHIDAPNLTYLTMYPSEESRLQAWKSFREHPAWKVLSKVEKYKGTVSKIHKYVLVPKAYSEM